MLRYLFYIVLLVLVVIGTVQVVNHYRTPGSMTVVESQAMDMSVMKPPPGTMPVRTEKVEETAFAPTITYTGSVKAWNDEDVVARVTGRVTQIHVYPGDRVAPGQLLVELDSEELNSRIAEAKGAAQMAQAKTASTRAAVRRSQASVEVAAQEVRLARIVERDMVAEEQAAKVNLRYKNAELERVKTLYDGDAVSLEELQKTRAETAQARMEDHHKMAAITQAQAKTVQAQLALAAAQAGVGETQAEHIGAGAAQFQQESAQRTAQILESYTRIQAQSMATVTERLVSPGTLVMPGTVLLRLKQTDHLRLQARVTSQEIEQIKVGSTVQYRRDPNAEFRKARITSIFREAEAGSKTVTVEAVVKGTHLVPGDYLEMTVALGHEQQSLTIPLAALQRDLDNKPFVWVLQQAGAPTKQRWTCVMHPEISEENPGKCPKCGMDLVPQEAPPTGTASPAVAQKADYTCVMHPEVSSDKPGKCPKCGMELEPREAPAKATATATPVAAEKVDYTCVMHPEVSSDKPGKCPKCDMELVPREKKGALTVHRQSVSLGGRSGLRVSITKGLSLGDEVVVAGASNLSEGMAVSRANGNKP